MKMPIITLPKNLMPRGEGGKIGYLIAWLLGVPAWILILVFLIKG